jgi:large subunit ribosomal protein L9
MDKMQIILTEDVANLGKSGELVSVKQGFGRNYLLPQGLAVIATQDNVKRIARQKALIEQRAAKARGDAEATAQKLGGVELTLERQTAEGSDKLFGSVTSKDIAEALAAKGHKVDKKLIHLPEPIRSTGEHQIEIKLGRGVGATIKLKVSPKA